MRMDKCLDISFVGILQNLGLPYALLYVDKRTRALYVFVRVAESSVSNPEFIAVEVTPNDVIDYMSERLGLVALFDNRNCFYVRFFGNNAAFQPYTFIKPNEKMERNNYFDPELCDDEIWVETVIERIKDNKPLETA